MLVRVVTNVLRSIRSGKKESEVLQLIRLHTAFEEKLVFESER